MGLLGLLKSFEELLYEVMTWLVFYPQTLLRVLRHPVRMMNYSDSEQGDTPDEQFIDTLSPPLFLMLSILIAHGIELSLHSSLDGPKSGIAASLLTSEESQLMLRCILFSIYPLTFATALINRSDQQLDRKTLRAPFFSQCYLGGLFVLLASAATIMGKDSSASIALGGAGLAVFAIAAFVAVQSLWFRNHLSIGMSRSIPFGTWTFVKATFLNSCVTAIFSV